MSTVATRRERGSGAASAHDRLGVRGASRAVPRRLRLQDPLPRGPGPHLPATHAWRLSALRARRHRAPHHDPAAPARRVLAAACHSRGARRAGRYADRARRRTVGVLGQEDEIDETELCERASVSPELVRQLEEFGLVVSRVEGGERLYGENEADIAAACARLARFGIDARHLRTFLHRSRSAGSARRAARRPGLALAQCRAPEDRARRSRRVVARRAGALAPASRS